MRVHFIAIGGSAMHNLAIALHKKGYHVTGSDDEIFEPSKSRLARYGLLPPTEGWDPARITPDLDAVILGMHARADNPELLKAHEAGMKIFSYPEYLYEQARDKKRIVIGGSHGKTTITAMILHVFKHAGIDCDYMVGAQLEGFDVMVRLTREAPCMIFEGDEYLTSPIDRRPKFHLYRPDIALLSGIAWDHINVFPTFENYVEQFTRFIDLVEPGGTLIWCSEDGTLAKICPGAREDLAIVAYGIPEYRIENGIAGLVRDGRFIPLKIFGQHNLMNLNGARLVCREMGISDDLFYEAIGTFAGAAKRLEKVAEHGNSIVFKDFAHAPSKVRATLHAVKEQFRDRHIVACLELHTYSSLSKAFLDHYRGALDEADTAIVYFSPHALALKRLPDITPTEVTGGFGRPDLEVYTASDLLKARLGREKRDNTVFLMMSSGNYDGIEVQRLLD